MLILDLETSCTSQDLASVMGIIGRLLNIICIIAPILLIISLSIKITKLVKDPDNKKLVPTIHNSIIAIFVLFMIPTIVNVVFNMMGEKYNISSCWMLAKNHKTSLSSEYLPVDDREKQKYSTEDPDEYEKGEQKSSKAKGGVTSELGEKLVQAGKTQLGLPYNSMHYGPREGDGLGFGCAMFVSYCYNQVFFGGVSGQKMGLGGFYGSTWEYWGNVTNDGYNAYNKTFVEVPASEARAGDVVAFLRGNDHYSSAKNCYHVALYEGNGQIIESGGALVHEGNIDINRSDLHFLRYMG